MFLTIRKYSGVTSRDEVIKRVEEGLVPQLKDFPGFVNYYAIEFDDGDLGGVNVFESKEASEKATEKAVGWVKENLAEFLPNEPQIIRGEVLMQTAAKVIAKTA